MKNKELQDLLKLYEDSDIVCLSIGPGVFLPARKVSKKKKITFDNDIFYDKVPWATKEKPKKEIIVLE
jgi:hypothetical protein